MVFNLNIPNLGENKTSKDYVILTLGKKYPLTKMRIYNEVRKQGFSATFHAVNKAVNELVKSNILSKKSKEYMLNYDWINQLYNFSEKVRSRFVDEHGCLIHGVKDMRKEGNITTLTFDSIYEMDKYTKSLHDYYYSLLKEDDAVCMVNDHHWWHLLYPEEEYRRDEVNRRFYCICTQNTTLDKIGIEFKKKLGMNAVHKKEVPFTNTVVYGDVIVQNFLSQSLRNNINAFFRKTKTLSALGSPKYFIDNVLKKKGKVILIVNKNQELAEEMRAQVMHYFRK